MPLDPSRIQALCFDVDGTLSDTDDLFVLKLYRWLKPLEFLLGGKDLRPFARKVVMATETPGNFLYGIPDRLNIDDELAAIGDFAYRVGMAKNRTPFLLIKGINEMLLTLSTVYPLAVVSARGRRSTEFFLDQFQLKPYFGSIVTAQTCRYTKPWPDPILFAAQTLGIAPENCLMIGDTVVDIKAGKAAGAQTVGVLCGFGKEDELIKAGADLILENTCMLPQILQPDVIVSASSELLVKK